MEIDVNKLKEYYGETYTEGYRLVYKENERYEYGSYSGSIEGFIYETYPYDPYPYYIWDEEIVFTTVDDLLERLLNIKNSIDEVFIYTVNGELIASKKRHE